VQQIPFISNRFAMKRFLGLSAEEVAENEKLWREENEENITSNPTDAAGEMRSVGISSAGISSDIGGAEDIDTTGEEPVAGGETAPPTTATGTTPGATTPPAGSQTI
jgi:hypothetical protein